MHKLELSSTELIELEKRLKTEKSNKIYRRLQCIHFKTMNFSHKIIASSLSIHIDTVTDWIKLYNTSGFDGLCNLQYEGRRISKLDTVVADMKKYIETEMINTVSQLQDYLLKEKDIFVEQSWLYRYCKKNSIHLIKRHD